ncbi:MAG: flagellar export protein FliJ [Tepidimonas ignava]|uniref:Flagellar FliJ protein n=1 Tax=Tepidimonas ignava TaxID=114249 RepID=A0A4R3L598_9BURK|nr:flagellar export protein FliJ [Tepidimonas ignava]MCX7814186.1 flagellar export protein FliJ [Tepidimonas ignava]TCS94552.1 flagellar FliJ protein [Tepidimonas ignava]TSE18808.1 flagellar export protein FliJ [Tepidimonas ignava]
MKKPADLSVLVQLRERQRDDALTALAQARRERALAEQQLAALQGYAREAEQRWTERARAGVSPTLLATQRHFMERLQHASHLQSDVLQQLDQRIAHCEAQWHKAERALATLRRLQQRRAQQWQQHLQRQEQKFNDDMALQQHRRRHAPRP